MHWITKYTAIADLIGCVSSGSCRVRCCQVNAPSPFILACSQERSLQPRGDRSIPIELGEGVWGRSCAFMMHPLIQQCPILLGLVPIRAIWQRRDRVLAVPGRVLAALDPVVAVPGRVPQKSHLDP